MGANYLGHRKCEFSIWAPFLDKVEVNLVRPEERIIPLERDARGYWRAVAEGIPPGALYFYRLDGNRNRPDPASHFQPDGVHGPSQVIDHSTFIWDDKDWRGRDISEFVIYEIHVGTFTPQGNFEEVTGRLGDLVDLGITAIELMPVTQFPGGRNWGYDGVYPYSVQNTYGGPEGLKRLVNECHKWGLAVILDVVYNHFGPEGNYIWDFGPYYTEKYKTPWGNAVNFDDAYSDEVRNFFIESAIHWARHYHIDGLRIDAIHAIYDMSARPFLQELADVVPQFIGEKKLWLIAESDLNDSRAIRPGELGGFGLDAQWCDDFHHALHTLLTGEAQGYYADFICHSRGYNQEYGFVNTVPPITSSRMTAYLAKSIREGFVYSGQYSVYRKRSHGNSSKDRPGRQLVVFTQNHDQTGNRMLGERLPMLVFFEALKLAAGAVLLSPYIPLLFMGEEYGEESPFLYFVSCIDPDLAKAVRDGRRREFSEFSWKGEAPDPQSEDTFLKSKINWNKRQSGQHGILLEFYKYMLRLRRETPALSNLNKDNLDVCEYGGDNILFVRRWEGDNHIFYVLNFNKAEADYKIYLPGSIWEKKLDSADSRWGGPGSITPERIESEGGIIMKPLSFVAYAVVT